MRKYFYLSLAVLLFSLLPCKAQYWDWAKQSTGGGGIGKQSAVDQNGNAYIIIERFCCSVGYGTQNFTSETVFAKHDASGNVQWAYPLNGVQGFAISTDTLNNVYVSGEYWNNAVFNSASNTQTMSSKGGYDAFLAKYNSNGNLLWIKTFGDTISNDNYTTLKTDVTGNSYLSGYESYTATTPVMHLAVRYMVSKYDSNGNLLWNITPSWENPAMPCASDLDSQGNYYITGNLINIGNPTTTTFGGTTLTINSSNYTIFIAKYDKNGNVVWAKTDGTNYDESKGIAVDNKGYFYLTGMHMNSSTFGTTTLSGPGNSGMFIVKHDTAGNVIWAKHENIKIGMGIACDSTGFFITAVINAPQNSPVGSPATGTLVSASGSIPLYSPKSGEFFVAKYDDSGNVKWALVPGGNTGQADWSHHIYSDRKGNCYVTGSFQGTTILGNTTLYSPYTNNNMEAFIVKVKDSITTTTSVKSIPLMQNNLSISPNPTGAAFNIIYNAGSGGNITLKICDAMGKCHYSTVYKNFNGVINETIDLSSLAKGIYIIEVVGTRTKETKLLVLQ